VRGRLSLIGAGLLALAGCGGTGAATSPTAPAPVVVDLPAASAGGACALLDYRTIEQTTGSRFNVSGASRLRQTSTCVVRSEGAVRPDLALSVTDTSVDAAVFTDTVIPGGGQNVSGLGTAAYRLILAPAKDSGAAVEVGWLSADGRLITLRYTFASGQERNATNAFAAKLTALAKKVDSSGG
jgi:hypothetical protein